MFLRSSPSQDDAMTMPSSAADRSTFSVIGSDVTVAGDIDASVDLHVDGKIDGDIRCTVLIQGGNSVITGAITAEQARIAGTVEGSIAAKDLIIEASASVLGDVTYEKLSIATGSHVEGHFRPKSAGSLNKPNAPGLAKDPPLTLVDEAPDDEKSKSQASAF